MRIGALIRLQIKAFVRRWPLMCVAAIPIIGVAFAGGFEVHLALQHSMIPADILAFSTRYSIILPLVIAVVTFEFACTPRVVGMQESAASHIETVHWHWIAMLAPPALLLSMTFSLYLALRVAVVFLTQMQDVLLAHVIAEAFLNILMPCTIGMILGVVAARRLGRYAGYAVIAFFAFVIGPYSEIVPFLAQIDVPNGGSGLNLYPIYDLFRLLAPDPMWGMDSLYGFPLEQGRWMIAGFWLLGLLALLYPAITSYRVRGTRYARVALLSLAVMFLVVALMPGSELRRDYRMFGGGSTVTEQIYYQFQIEEHPQRELPAEFRVSRYEMDLSAGRQLDAKVSMSITDDEHSDTYNFTLYHGYRISHVLDDKGNRLEFIQDGDYVTVTSSEAQDRLTFEYSGSGGMYVANYQCVFLPGYMSYYPIPGFVRVWDEGRGNPTADTAGNGPAEFSVKFAAPIRLASNLEQHDGRFEGVATNPSFVGGLLVQSTIDDHNVVHYPAGGGDPTQLKNMIASLRELERELEVSESLVPGGTTVFQVPGLAQTGAVVLPDALFSTGFDESCAVDILVAATPTRIDRENLKMAFSRFISDPDGFEDTGFMLGANGPEDTTDEEPLSNQIARLESARLEARNDFECAQEYVFPARSTVYRLFFAKVRAEGEEEALRGTYRYLSSDSHLSELEFLTQSDSEVTQ